MKKIVCELCDGMEFAKEDGMFICQGCGTKYSVEEAKAMMKEVDGEGASPAVGNSGANANQQQIDNLLILATNAFEATNNQEAEGYCNKIIELDVTCYKAWLIKGQAVGWQSTYGRPRVEEGANAMRKAVDFAPEEEKEEVAREALEAIKNICNALASLARDNFGETQTENHRFKFGEFLKICSNATALFDDVSPIIAIESVNKLREHKRRSAEYMNLAGVAATKYVRNKWKSFDHPSHDLWKSYLDWYGEIRMMFEDSISWGLSAGEEDKEIITRYNNKIIAIEDPMNSCSWKREWNSWTSNYEWQRDFYLADSAKTARRDMIKECKAAIKKIEDKAKRKAEEEKRAAEEARKKRIEEYWEAHKEEKDKETKRLMGYIADHHDNLLSALNDEQKELLEKFDDCYNELTDINEREIFSYAFKLGARMMLEVLSNTESTR